MSSSTPLDLYCLCAAWCGTCQGYQRLMSEVVARHPGVRAHWVDIEDEADRVGDLDIETFPTLLLAQGDKIRFFGVVLPHEAALEQLLHRAAEWDRDNPEASALLTRLRA